MALAKLKILVENKTGKFEEKITALFNPSEITIDKRTNWQKKPVAESDRPELQFTSGEASTLSLNLFFDTYEAGTDVRAHTQQVVKLALVDGQMHRPPICQLVWGKFGVFFQGVLQSLNQKFTLFLADGTPVRATLTCSFEEWYSSEDEAKRQNKQSVDVAKKRTVRRGDTLSSIASEEYNDPTLWRHIAEANQIDNPRALVPGQVLAIPALRSRRGMSK